MGGWFHGCCVHCNCPAVLQRLPELRQFSLKGAKMMENLLAGAVAVGLILYLLIALVRPEKF
jgi:K+-transporting ATPase KdpF subunit